MKLAPEQLKGAGVTAKSDIYSGWCSTNSSPANGPMRPIKPSLATG
jgi:hypothetical protein